MSEVAITFAVIAGDRRAVIEGRLAVEVVAIGAALVLWATGVLTIDQALAGFDDLVSGSSSRRCSSSTKRGARCDRGSRRGPASSSWTAPGPAAQALLVLMFFILIVAGPG